MTSPALALLEHAMSLAPRRKRRHATAHRLIVEWAISNGLEFEVGDFGTIGVHYGWWPGMRPVERLYAMACGVGPGSGTNISACEAIERLAGRGPVLVPRFMLDRRQCAGCYSTASGHSRVAVGSAIYWRAARDIAPQWWEVSRIAADDVTMVLRGRAVPRRKRRKPMFIAERIAWEYRMRILRQIKVTREELATGGAL
jgi:hypothetical protein